MRDHCEVTHPRGTEHLALVRGLVLLLDRLGEEGLAQPGGGPGLDRDVLLVIEPVCIQQRREVDVGEVATDELVEVPVDVLEMLVAWESAQRQLPIAALGARCNHSRCTGQTPPMMDSRASLLRRG